MSAVEEAMRLARALTSKSDVPCGRDAIVLARAVLALHEEGDRGTLLAKLYGARSAADFLRSRVTALEAALRDMCNTAESHAAGSSDRAQVRHVVGLCRAILDGGGDAP